MKLNPRELDKLLLHNVGSLAQKRLARGLRLNHPEAVALIASVLLELIRDGYHTVSELMDMGKKLLGFRQIVPGVEKLIHEVQIEGTFLDGTKLVTVHDPICSDNGDLSLALYGSFCPVPDLAVFDLSRPLSGRSSGTGAGEEAAGGIACMPRMMGRAGKVAAGVGVSEPMARRASVDEYDSKLNEITYGNGDIVLNEGRQLQSLKVTSLCDRPIQVGSHFHLVEANKHLKFDRALAYGMRLNIPAGTAVRFEPGDTKTVSIVEIAGKKVIQGGNRLASGPCSPATAATIADVAATRGFENDPYLLSSPTAGAKAVVPRSPYLRIPRSKYCEMFGPTTGDKIRLGDTGLVAEIEHDYAVYGDEAVFGGGKVLRDGMGQNSGLPEDQCLQLVITNCVILDYTGIYKADIGIRNGLISGIGKAGNPDVMAGVTAGMVIGATTEVMAGEGLIVTAGGIDTHIHFISPQQAFEAIAAGVTTMIGGGTGPATGTNATTCTPSSFYIAAMLQSTDAFPLNFGFTGKGNSSDPAALVDQINAGAMGLKLHEDWGSTPAAIDTCLQVAEDADVQVTIHTDTLNEAGCVEDTIAAFKGRTIHTYHSEGAGGGHAPDIIRVVGDPSVLPSSTNPTCPFTRNTLDEHVDMLMVCHHLSRRIPEDVAFAESRIRSETIAAEDVLHDLGAISMFSSDSQAMGRIGEVITRTWQTAAKMKKQRGALVGEKGSNDNLRIRRFVSKYTINPAIAHGVGHVIGSVEVGKLADLVLWSPAFFGIKPEIVVKGGIIAWSQMGDANASIPTPEPLMMRPMFGAFGRAVGTSSVAFVSKASVDKGSVSQYGLTKRLEPVRNCRNLTKKDMKLNDYCPRISVDPETFRVVADGVEITCAPAMTLPLTRRYCLF